MVVQYVVAPTGHYKSGDARTPPPLPEEEIGGRTGRGPGYGWRAQAGEALDAGGMEEHSWGRVSGRWWAGPPLSALHPEAHVEAKGVARPFTNVCRLIFDRS